MRQSLNYGGRQPNSPGTTEPPHALSGGDVLEALVVDSVKGLSQIQVVERCERFGPNVLTEAAAAPLWRRFLGQFNELVIWILIVAAVISGVMGEWVDTVVILAIVFVNGILGLLQEERAGRALAALQRLSAPMARVVRDGALQSVPARDLVPGDCLALEAGDHIAADARLLDTISFRVQEAALTGESLPVAKDANAVLASETALADRRNMIYQGTVVTVGKARAVVVAIGMETELGRIAGLLQRAEPEPTPLQIRLAELGRMLVYVCVGIVAVVFVLELLRGGKLVEVFLRSVSLAVAAVPEGLPAVVTMALALGLHRMVKRNALVRKLPSVETLGCVTVICSDKTGTLTRNEMTVREVVAGGVRYQVTGVGYKPQGHFLRQGQGDESAPIDPLTEADLLLALTIAARCHNARLAPGSSGGDTWQIVGDPTEGALVVVAAKAGVDTTTPYHLLYEIPFDSDRKRMSVAWRTSEGMEVLYCKGAPEVILGRCGFMRALGKVEPLTDERRQEVLRGSDDMAARALRVLALAYREQPAAPDVDPETDMTFVGLAGMIDPPREEVKEAVARCSSAGIRAIMITGDHPATALAIARELGIAAASATASTGQELDRLSDDELAGQVERTAVYARVTAEHKLRIVRALKRCGQVVAMTGDGANDAPAVKAADIGIAMGLGGTDVTREASDMVLTDDNFASIVNAVEEGRGIFDNIQKFLHYLLAGNIGLVLFVFLAALFNWPFPLATTQILWINLVTNGLPALALGMEPVEPDVMRRKPRPAHEPVITGRRGLVMFLEGTLVAAVTAIGFAVVYQGEPERLAQARMVAFCVVSYAFMFYAFSCRSRRFTMPRLGVFSNPHLVAAVAFSGLLQLGVVTLPFTRPVFETEAHSGGGWLLILLLALTPVTIIEVAKLLRAGLSR